MNITSETFSFAPLFVRPGGEGEWKQAYETDFNHPPLVTVNGIAILVMVTKCKSWQNLQVLFSLLQLVA